MKNTVNQLFLLLSLVFISYTSSLAQNISVSGITNPAAANGVYEPNGTLYGYDSWKHETQDYYIYNDDYTGRYWNIDDNTDDESSGVLFYSSAVSSVLSPVDVPSWDALGTTTTPSPIGTPNLVNQAATSTPTIMTQAVSAITTTTATGNGNITDLGAPNPTAHGICWNTVGTPTIADSNTDEGAASATGAFTSNITSLSPNTMYYVRAYATNTAGTSYGNQVSFTSSPMSATITTQAVSAIMTTTATGNGNITDLGAPNPTAHGICWNTVGTPTIADNNTNEGAASATGAFTSNITSLSPNTLYYVRAYATNTAGTSYGNQVSFTTSPMSATITTQVVSAIMTTTATGNGNITDLGAPNPTAHGICWNTVGTPTIADNNTDEGAASATGAFTSNLTTLSPNTMYYVRAYATNTAGTSYGNQVSFTSSPMSATITTQAVSSITSTTATGNGNITDLGAPNPTAHGICWNTAGTPTIADNNTDEGAVSATGSFTSNITSLSPNTMYYVRAYATNTAGTSYGSQVSFTSSLPTGLEDLNSTNITIYPNPVSDVLNIAIESSLKSDDVSISIIDATGKTVFSENYTETSCKINVSNFNPGLYFVAIKSSGSTEIKKIIIE